MKKVISILLVSLCVISLAACNQATEAPETTAEETTEAQTTVEETTIEETTSEETVTVNPYQASWITEDMVETLKSIKRVDEKGILYEMNYTADYYDEAITTVVEQAGAALSSGCSAFSSYNTEGEFLLCRSYDYRHKDANGEYSGLNVVLYTAPEGKLKSIGVCDACWLDTSAYFQGALDDGTTDISAMMLAPYMCVDGMNEAGLTASLLVADVKEGETMTNQNTGKERAMHSQLLRYIIDNAHNIEEAVEIAKNYDIYSVGGTDLHMFLVEKSGASAVLEWRQYDGAESQELYVTYTNVVTNFLVGFDDAADAYNADGTLKELFSGFDNTYNHYLYGYGHGYHRFNTIVASLERYISTEENKYGIRNSVMEETQILDVLRVVSQNPGTEKTSFTQFSAIYHLDQLSVTMWMQRDYSQSYTFSLNE